MLASSVLFGVGVLLGGCAGVSKHGRLAHASLPPAGSLPSLPTPAVGATTTLPGSAGTTAPPTSSADSSTSTTGNPFLRRPGVVAFLAPSGNTSCEIDFVAGGSTNTAFCETLSPPQSATLSPSGAVKTCGLPCEGNAAVGTPTLPYGGETGLGPFQCQSAQAGVSCTVSGSGFEISRAGVTPVGTPPVTFAPGSYSGTVANVNAGVSQMTFTVSSTGCSGVPSPGTWSVDLQGAAFVSNSEPSTGQGQAVTVGSSQWQQEEQTNHTWTVVVTSGRPLEVTDGPTC